MILSTTLGLKGRTKLKHGGSDLDSMNPLLNLQSKVLCGVGEFYLFLHGYPLNFFGKVVLFIYFYF